MTLTQAMAKLESLGSEQTRKTYIRHGAQPDNLFGVKYGDLEKLAKSIKQDHQLALQLWDTGNHDARVLATRIIDVDQLTAKQLDAWVKNQRHRIINYDLSAMVARSKFAASCGAKWRKSKQEWISCTGWTIVSAQLVTDDTAFGEPELAALLEQIEAGIADAPNMTRYAMNGALIAIGGVSPALREKAIAAAKRIGEVKVDHGNTACQTPSAVPYIQKMWAHKAKRAKHKAAKKAAKKKAAKSKR